MSRLKKLETRQRRLETRLRRTQTGAVPAVKTYSDEELVGIHRRVSVTPVTPSVAVHPHLVPPPLPSRETLGKEPDSSNLEFWLGTKGFVRIGVVLVVIGLIFAANYAYQHLILGLGPWQKVVALGGLAMGLMAGAEWLERRQANVRAYARALLAGGMALGFYTLYGLIHVEALRVMSNETAGVVLLLFWALAMAWVADVKRSQVLAVFSFSLGYLVVNVSDSSLVANGLLAVAAVGLGVRRGWSALAWVGLIGTYAGFVGWRVSWFGNWVETKRYTGSGLSGTILWLTGYWLVLVVGVWNAAKRWNASSRLPLLALNHAIYFLLMWSVLPYPAWPFWKWAALAGVGLAVLAWISEGADRKADRSVQGVMAIFLGALATVTYFTGPKLALILAAEAVVLAEVALWRKSRWIRGLALAAVIGAVVVTLENAAEMPSLGLIGVAGLLLATSWRMDRGGGLLTPGLVATGFLVVLLLWLDRVTDEAWRSAIVALVAAGWWMTGRWGGVKSWNLTPLLLLTLALAQAWERSVWSVGMISETVPALVLLLAQRWLRKHSGTVSENWQVGLVLLGCVGLTHEALQAMHAAEATHWETLLWTGMGLVSFGVGFALRERTYRWFALALLGWALLRVVFGDLWDLGAGWRIVSVLGLGVILLVLGYVYNRYQNKLREWI